MSTDAPATSSVFVRFLLRLSGVDEEALRKAPFERTRYLGLAWTMLMTAALAATGMAILIGQISNTSPVIHLLAAVAWGVFVLGIDYLVVGFVDKSAALVKALTPPWSRIRTRYGPAFLRYAVRIVFALVVGLAVGESLVIGAFGPASVRYLNDQAEDRILADICRADYKLSTYRPEVQPAADCARRAGTAGVQGPAGTSPASVLTPGSSPAPPATDQSSADTARLADLDKQILFYNDRAQCELYPQNFSQQRIVELGCSGRAGSARAYDAAISQVKRLEGEKQQIQLRITNTARNNAELAADLLKAQEEKNKTDARIRDENRNSPQAMDAAAEKAQLEHQLLALRTNPPKRYGLSERFDATEHAVNPWIRWGLRLLFVLADMAPVLMKVTMGPSSLDEQRAIADRRQKLLVLMDLVQEENRYREVQAGKPVTLPPNGPSTYGGSNTNGRRPSPETVLPEPPDEPSAPLRGPMSPWRDPTI